MTDPNSPMTRAEADEMKASAQKGIFPTLETLKRYLAMARASFLSQPKKVEASKKTRNKKAGPATPDQIDFF